MSDETSFRGKGFDYCAGYHAAMRDVGNFCLSGTKDAEGEHAAVRPTLLGGPRSAHYLALGKGRAFLAVSTFATEKGQEAFLRRNDATPPTGSE